MSNRRRVLVVDDEENVAVTLQAVLERAGYDVEKALSFSEAQDLIRQQRFDAALVDLRLGDNDGGLSILRDLAEQQPDCMAIMLTGFASLESAIGALRQGAYDYLIKPCDLEELKLTIARAVEHSAVARVVRSHIGEIEASNKALRSLTEDLRKRLEETMSDLRDRPSEGPQKPDQTGDSH